MTLSHDFRQLIAAYLRHEQPLSAVRSWLECEAQAVAASADVALDDMTSEAWLAISELDVGDITEDDVRNRLSPLAGERSIRWTIEGSASPALWYHETASAQQVTRSPAGSVQAGITVGKPRAVASAS